ncbi:MAG: NAD(P)-dependent oxidoreductase [Chloroflexota bacterium]
MANIAYLGMGVMGSGMAANLIKAGHQVTVWNRTKEKCQPLVDQGATMADTPAEAASGAAVVMYCLANDDAVETVVWGDNGLLGAARSGQAFVDMSTVSPALSRREAMAFHSLGVDFLDAPVFGSKNEAAQGGLWIVVGSRPNAFDRIKPLLEPLSETIHYMGENGKGATMKLVGNAVVALQLAAVGETLLLAKKAGLNLHDVLGVLDVTDFRSPIISNVGRAVLRRDFSVSFELRHLLKDANLIAHLAEDHDVPMPAEAAARETIRAAVNQGYGEENASAMVKALESWANIILD